MKEFFKTINEKLAEEIEQDIEQYIENKYGKVCDIDFHPIHRIDIVSPECGDWKALYVDGKLFAEGHSLTARDVFDSIADIFPNKLNYQEVSDERAEEGFPEKLEDICNEYRLDLMSEYHK